MSAKRAEGIIIMSAVVVLSIWGFRTLYETGQAVAGASTTKKRSGGLKELAGLEAHPAHPAQFLVGFGFVYFVLSIIATGAPRLAANFAILIAVGDTLANGMGVFSDIGKATAGATTAEGGATTEVLTAHRAATSKESQVARPHA